MAWNGCAGVRSKLGLARTLDEALEVPKEKLLGLGKKKVEEEASIAQSRMLQQVWPLAADLPVKEQQYLAKMTRTLAAQNGT